MLLNLKSELYLLSKLFCSIDKKNFWLFVPIRCYTKYIQSFFEGPIKHMKHNSRVFTKYSRYLSL